MSHIIDLQGKKFSLLTVLNKVESKNGKAYWNCLCECGNFSIVSGSNLRTGAVKSCGCLLRKQKNTHHLSKTRLYRIWRAMITRCNDKNYWAYKYYGAKGIGVCKQWQTDFIAFKNWADLTGYSDNLTLDRFDNGKNYCPENCKWSTRKEQANNRDFCKKIDFNGKTQTLMQWCEELGLNYKLIYSRLYKCGWTFEKAISTPKRTQRKEKNYGM